MVQAFAEKHIPTLLYDDSNIEDDNYIIKVYKRDSLKFFIDNNNGELNWTIPLKIYAKARVQLGFIKTEQDGTFELDAHFATLINLSQDWRLVLSTHPVGFEWKHSPTIKLGFVEVNIGQFINPLVESQLKNAAQVLDNYVANSVTLKPLAEAAFNYLQSPFDVLQNGEVWLKFTPTKLSVSPLAGSADKLHIQWGIKGISETFLGKKPAFKALELLPLYQEPIIDSLFNIQLAAEIPFKEIEKYATQWLKSQTFEWDNGAKKIQIENFSIYGSGKQVIIKTLMKGSYNGTVYFSGIPALDTLQKTIYFKDLDFDLETKNQINKAAAWLLHGLMVQKLKNNLKFNYKPYVEQTLRSANQLTDFTMANKLVNVKINLNNIHPYQLELIPDNFLVKIKCTGTTHVLVNLQP